MRMMERRFRYGIESAGVLIAVLCVAFASAFAQGNNTPGPGKAPGNTAGGFQVPQKSDQTCIGGRGSCGKAPGNIVGGFQNVHPLPPGGPAPRTSDGHVDLTGRWYPNAAGRMLQGAYPLDRNAIRQFDPKATPEEKPSYKPGVKATYARPYPYGGCDQAGTPGTTLQQSSQHAPMELIQTLARVVMLDEYPLDVRMIYMNREHPKDPDPTFNGDSAAHWEGDTLVVDVIALDSKLRNTVPAEAADGWFPSEQEHVVERFTRTSKNYLIYEVTIDDPLVLTKPWKSAPRTWSLAQDANDEWTEVFCTHNEEPDEIKKIDVAREKGK
jgi:hypothetical protein